MEIIPKKAAVVRQIFEWYCSRELLPDNTYRRLGPDAIALRLDTLGVKPTVNATWAKATITGMLCNKIYAGCCTHTSAEWF